MMIEIHPSIETEGSNLIGWLSNDETLEGFPMTSLAEVDDAVRIWMGYIPVGSCLTAWQEKKPVGMGLLYINTYRALAHQCLLAIVVDNHRRNQGIGQILLKALIELAKGQFKIELLHLEVYAKNPAIRLYSRLGFKEYGRDPRFIKVSTEYREKVLMQKFL